MAKFAKKRSNTSPTISTASLPDIIFILLFFFMVVVKLRETNIKVKSITPAATELTKLEKKSLVNTMYIGRPLTQYQNVYGTKPRLQLNDKIADLAEIPIFLERHKVKVPEGQRQGITTSMKIDGDVTMGFVTDVKTSLRKAGQLKLNYSAKKRTERSGF
ncbi:MAG: biopolymer transporter ExbD [Saprospiraceae bacterium]|jgi:biopolymer transport protein ExbD|nr:biopolymer transporter ExbD [Saprospiraceae bacterium]